MTRADQTDLLADSGQREAAPIIPPRYSPRFSSFFAKYSRRLIRKKFAAARIVPESIDIFEEASRHDGPLIIAISHASWWDPLVALVLAQRFDPDRPTVAPMEYTELARFRFMTRLGLFGINPDHPRAMATASSLILGRFRETPRSALWITPQGEFADPRAAIRIRPGAAAVASALSADETWSPPPRVMVLAIEYAFWTEQRPEIFIRAESVEPEATNTPGWHRAITRAMRWNAEQLASRVIAREPAAFADLLGHAGSDVHPVYDAWLRLTGRSAKIDPVRRRDAEHDHPASSDPD